MEFNQFTNQIKRLFHKKLGVNATIPIWKTTSQLYILRIPGIFSRSCRLCYALNDLFRQSG